jgi:hypothetical protein
MRKQLLIACLAAMAVVSGATNTFAQSDTTTVNYEVTQVSLVNIAATSVTLTVNAGTAGTGLTDATASTSYAITNNATNQKLTGAINSAMPANTTLKLTVAAPAGSGTSQGQQTLTATAVDLVTGVGAVNESGLGMDFVLSATVDAGIVASASKTLTLTLTSGA